jgi:hypothetical protein
MSSKSFQNASKLNGIVSVLQFGAVGDGTTNDTAAIQAAINYVQSIGEGRVHFPAGAYACTGPITITSSNISLTGDGVGATFIGTSMTSGDFILFKNPSGTLNNIGMRDLTVIGGAQNQTSGALVKLSDCYGVFFSNVELRDYFGCLHLETVVEAFFSSVNLRSDNNFTSIKVDSYLLRLSQSAEDKPCSEVHFVGIDWRGERAFGSNYLYYGILAEAFDGVWFEGAHLGFCQAAAIYIKPQSTTASCTGFNLTNGWLDQVPNGPGLHIVEPAGYTGYQGAHSFHISQISGCYRGVQVNCLTKVPFSIKIGLAYFINYDAVFIQKGNDISISIDGTHEINTTGGGGVVIDGSGTGYKINAAIEKTGATAPNTGIYLSGSVDQIEISGRFKECVADITNVGTGRNIQIGNILTDKSISNVTAASPSGIITLPLAEKTFFLQPVNPVGAINTVSAAKGKIVTLISTGTVTVNDSNNLRLNGAFAMQGSYTLTLICDGTDWYELSRSTN